MIDKLMQIKKIKGLSNEQLADAIGIKRITLHRWTNLISKPSPMALNLIKKYISKNEKVLKNA